MMKKTLVIVVLCVIALATVVRGQQEEEEGVMAEPRYRGCPDVCPALFDPVCAVLGKRYRTFGNECELQRYNCKNHQRWRKVSDSACPYDN